MSNLRKSSLIKPTIDTPLHIDYEWWKSHDHNWRVYLRSCLCQDHQKEFAKLSTIQPIDAIDARTGEVTQVDGLEYVLLNHCARQPDFLNENTTIVNAVFRVFLSNGNTPLSSAKLSAITEKPAEMILRTLAGFEVYKGIRPVQFK